jgi:hypothetical protein
MGFMVPQPFAPRREPVVSRFLGHNQLLAVLGVLDPDSSPRAFHGAGGRSCSLNGRHYGYSYAAAGAATGFSGETMGLKPLWS